MHAINANKQLNPSSNSSTTSLSYLDLKENTNNLHYGYGGRFRPLPMRMNFLKIDMYPDRYSHMKSTRLEYPEFKSASSTLVEPSTPTTTTTATVHSSSSYHHPQQHSSTPLSPVAPSPPTSPTTTANTTTNTLQQLSQQDTNKPKSTRKPKKRNNIRYMTQPVRLIEIQEQLEEEAKDNGNN